MPSYQLCSTDGRGYLIPLETKPITIGRHPDNLLVLPDEAASRFHAVVELQRGGRLVVRDLGSRNGTKVNSTKIIKDELEVEAGGDDPHRRAHVRY